MLVNVNKQGTPTEQVVVNDGATVADALAACKNGDVPSGWQVQVNMEPANMDTALSQGAIISIVHSRPKGN